MDLTELFSVNSAHSVGEMVETFADIDKTLMHLTGHMSIMLMHTVCLTY